MLNKLNPVQSAYACCIHTGPLKNRNCWNAFKRITKTGATMTSFLVGQKGSDLTFPFPVTFNNTLNARTEMSIF